MNEDLFEKIENFEEIYRIVLYQIIDLAFCKVWIFHVFLPSITPDKQRIKSNKKKKSQPKSWAISRLRS